MRQLKIGKTLFCAALAMVAGAFLFSGVASAATINKELNAWADPDAVVYNSDNDNIIHFDITCDLDNLLAEARLDSAVNQALTNAGYNNRWRGRVLKSSFTSTDDIDKMIGIDYMHDTGDPTYIFWTDWGLRDVDTPSDGTPDPLTDPDHTQFHDIESQ